MSTEKRDQEIKLEALEKLLLASLEAVRDLQGHSAAVPDLPHRIMRHAVYGLVAILQDNIEGVERVRIETSDGKQMTVLPGKLYKTNEAEVRAFWEEYHALH